MINNISIRKGTIAEAVLISNEIPEFDKPHDALVYKKGYLIKIV